MKIHRGFHFHTVTDRDMFYILWTELNLDCKRERLLYPRGGSGDIRADASQPDSSPSLLKAKGGKRRPLFPAAEGATIHSLITIYCVSFAFRLAFPFWPSSPYLAGPLIHFALPSLFLSLSVFLSSPAASLWRGAVSLLSSGHIKEAE